MAKAKQGPENHTAGTKFIVLSIDGCPTDGWAFSEQGVGEFKTYQDAKDFVASEEDGTYAIFELKSVFSVKYEVKVTELK